MDKKGASFGTVVAILGSILIALGFAWLIMKNWHYFNSFVIARYDFVKYMQKISDIEQFHENGKLNIEILQKIIF